ncbi:hypothetical protein DVS77_27140 [Mycolicibacterium moriokaense]|nr:hypothetical protein DVS77_27140 [Mycolicibacterium moriokaense]
MEIGVGDNGCIVAHPMRYAAIVEHMAHVVTELESVGGGSLSGRSPSGRADGREAGSAFLAA